MKFELSEEQRAFAGALDGLLSSADTAGVARSWAAGDHAPGRKLWDRLSEQGLTMLATEATSVEVCIAFEALGRYAVPGPWVESAAYLPLALGHEVEGLATVAVPPHTPYALDADVADTVYLAGPDGLVEATAGEPHRSVDLTRHLFSVASAPPPVDVARPLVEAAPGPLVEAARPLVEVRGAPAPSLETKDPFDLAALATAAQLLGAGERVLADSVTYVKQRRQFGREIGSYQAIKHQLADVRIALDFARPLVFGAALALDDASGTAPRAVSAAKVMCADAAYLASRTGLQVHGAIGYTQEFDLSIWITKIRALVTAWGTPAFHRARILDSLVGA